jgi:hypothetical protein
MGVLARGEVGKYKKMRQWIDFQIEQSRKVLNTGHRVDFGGYLKKQN